MGHTVYFLNPFGHNGLPDNGFNPLACLDPDSPSFAADVAVLSPAIVIPEDRQPHWSDSARQLIECLIMWVCKTEEKPTLPKVRAALTLPSSELKKLMLQISLSDYVPMAQLASRFAEDDFRDVPGIISTAQTQTKWINDLIPSLSSNSFDWAALKREKITVFAILPPNRMTSHFRWLRLIVTQALNVLQTPEKPEKPVLFILDEFAQLERLETIENAMGQAAGHHVQIWPILQDLNQLQRLYRDGWQTFVSNTGICQVFQPNDKFTAGYFSDKAGKSTVRTTGANEGINSREGVGRFGTATEGQSSGYSYGETGKPLFSVQDLAGLPPDQQVIFKAGLQYPILADRVAYYHDAALAGRYDPDPYHRGQTPPPPPTPVVWGPAAPKVEDLKGWGWGVLGVAVVAGLGVDILLGGEVAAAEWAAGAAVGVATLALAKCFGKERGLRTKKILNAVGSAKWSRRSLVLLLGVAAGLTSLAHLKVKGGPIGPLPSDTHSSGKKYNFPGVLPERQAPPPAAEGSPEPWHPRPLTPDEAKKLDANGHLPSEEAIPVRPNIPTEEILRKREETLKRLRKGSEAETTLPTPSQGRANRKSP